MKTNKIVSIDTLSMANDIPNVKIMLQVLKSDDVNYATAYNVIVPANRDVDREEFVAAYQGLLQIAEELRELVERLEEDGVWGEY